MQGVIPLHRQHIVQALLRLRRVGGVRRGIEGIEQSLQASRRVPEVGRVALEVANDLGLGQTRPILENPDRLPGKVGVARKSTSSKSQRVLDSLTIGGWRGSVSGSRSRRRQGKRQRTQDKGSDQVARLQKALAPPGCGLSTRWAS